jgi:acyl-CoA synthetase (AMP-forming)/AMP-acid ligase II
MNIPQLWREKVQNHPDKVFLYFEGLKITYGQMYSRINRVANQLAKRGVDKGDFFALMQTNSPAFLYTWFALNSLGAVSVPINPVFTESEMKYILKHSGAKGIMLEERFLEILAKIDRADVPRLKMVICNGLPGDADQEAFENLLTGDDSPPDVAIDDRDPCVCIYTSGTTDMPKGVLNSHFSWTTTGRSYAYTVGIGPDDRVMTPNPLFHANAQVYSTMGALSAGGSLILLTRFSKSRIIEQARRYQATKMVLVQAVTPWVWGRERKPYDNDHQLDTMVAGNVTPDIYHDFEKRFALKIQTIYSLTESVMALMGPRAGTMERKPGGVGIPMEHPDKEVNNRVMIVDPAGFEVPPGKQGEIIIKNPCVMLGYLNDPEKTAQTKIDGWIHTGDIGYRDADGYVFFVGRQKEVIRRRGELISPQQIESVINRHEQVEESAVIGVPSDLGTGEEEVMAFIRRVSGGALNVEQVREWCSKALADFKVPRFIEFRDSFEKSAIGRIKKDLLKKEIQDRS